MKTKPILFSTPMVKAIMNGTKTQTRRIITPQPTLSENAGFCQDGYCYGIGSNKKETQRNFITCKAKIQVGDVFWVRETHKVGAWNDEDYKVAFDYKASPELKKTPWCEFQDLDRFNEYHQKILSELDKLGIEPTVDEEKERFYYNWKPGESPFKWKPSIFMPKEACRLFLKCTNIRVELLQDISEEDAIAEGIENICDGIWAWRDYLKKEPTIDLGKHTGIQCLQPYTSFRSLWHSINGVESGNDNPFTFVYDFEITERPENFI